MKLLNVTLTDLLAYDGETVIDLSETRPGRNIVLIWGRNGRGKTSFINALKLLFGGIEEERARRVGFPSRPLPAGQFVRGDGEHWIGLVNRRAQARADRERQPAIASVEANWEADGRTVHARRAWTVTPTGFTETLAITDGGMRLTGEAATERLAYYLPAEYVGFFFFDGEDIKSLAETSERKVIDFDRLLRITFVSELASELAKVAIERRRRTMNESDRNQLRDIERDMAESRYIKRDSDEQLSRIGEDLVTQTAALRKAEAIRDNLGSGASDAQREALEVRKRQLASQLSEGIADIVAKVPTHAPMIANLSLVDAALDAIERRIDLATSADQILVGRIDSELPSWIDAVDLNLDVDARQRLVVELRSRLAQLVAHDDDTGIFADLDLGRAESVRRSLLRFSSAGRDMRSTHLAMLTATHRAYLEHIQVEDDLMRLNVGSQANLERYRDAVRQIANANEAIATLNQQKGTFLGRRQDAIDKRHRLENAQREMEALMRRASRDQDEARFVERVVLTLNELREALRMAARNEVQRLLNERFKELVTEHNLVERIEIDETYTLNYFDAAGRPVGRASLSSGLKQLAATALLWAMKDAAGYDMPVVIDTPLGRIDRENQNNMLVNYYPRLSHQVVILPTNAEIDERKKRSIEHLIAAEYLIDNDAGDSATVRRDALVNI